MNDLKNLNSFLIILASKSPRRQELLKKMGINFEIIVREVDEIHPEHFSAEEIVLHLCQLKSADFKSEEMDDKTIIITADTIVWFQNHVLNKPENLTEAFDMLKKLSGKRHDVYTGVCLKSKNKTHSFYVMSKVYFKNLSDEEITFYVNKFKPLDKAGAYGIQEWIGFIGIEKIEGSYFNVMGLPTKELYEELIKFI